MAASPVDLPSPLGRCRKQDRQPHWLTRLLRRALGCPPLPMPIKGQHWVSEWSGEVERIADVRVESDGRLSIDVAAWSRLVPPGDERGGMWALPNTFHSLEAWRRHIREQRRVLADPIVGGYQPLPHAYGLTPAPPPRCP